MSYWFPLLLFFWVIFSSLSIFIWNSLDWIWHIPNKWGFFPIHYPSLLFSSKVSVFNQLSNDEDSNCAPKVFSFLTGLSNNSFFFFSIHRTKTSISIKQYNKKRLHMKLQICCVQLAVPSKYTTVIMSISLLSPFFFCTPTLEMANMRHENKYVCTYIHMYVYM